MSHFRCQAITWLVGNGSHGNFFKFRPKSGRFFSRKCTWKCCVRVTGYFGQGLGITKAVFVDLSIKHLCYFAKIAATCRFSCSLSFWRVSLQLTSVKNEHGIQQGTSVLKNNKAGKLILVNSYPDLNALDHLFWLSKTNPVISWQLRMWSYQILAATERPVIVSWQTMTNGTLTGGIPIGFMAYTGEYCGIPSNSDSILNAWHI